MANVHRIMWLDQEIRQHKYPNCRKLAEHFEISWRQANRDLEYLKNTLNAPINYIAAKRGYVYDDMTYILPNFIITDEERKILSFLAYRYNNFDGNENSQRIANLFRNLSDFENPEHSSPVFNINNNRISLFHDINHCINKQKKLNVSYLTPDGEQVHLILHPYTLYGKSDNDYLVAYCEEYEDIAIFRLDRFNKWSENNKAFVKNISYNADNYIGFMKRKPFKTLLITNSPECNLNYLGDKVTKLDEGLYEIDFYDINQMVRELMISNQWKDIKSPNWLKDKIRNQCKKIYDKL
ncbi:MAG: WYL domain-containing protein [Clostridiales bacterium]|nr:WYL domain-containing protein [Clostridiales bacterium]